MSDPGKRGDSIARNSAFALASQLTTAAFTAVITVFLVRALDPSGYGIFALALSVAAVLMFPADFGISLAAARFVAERRGRAPEVAAVIFRALGLKLLLSLLMAVAMIALAAPISALLGEPDLVWPLRVVAIAVVGQSLVFLFANAFVALGRVSWQFALISSEAAIEATATIGLVVLAGGATAAVAGRAVGYCVGAVLGALFLLRLLGRHAVIERAGGPERREFIAYAGALLIIDGAYAVFSQVDVLLVGGLLGAQAAGVYGAAVRLTIVLSYPGLALSQGISPRMARHPDHPPEVGALAAGVRGLIILQAAIAVGVAAWAEPLVALVLGPGYSQSADVLQALAPFIFLSGLGPLVSTSVNYVGAARRRIPIALGCAVLNIVLAYALIKSSGVTGAAISVDVSYALYVGAHLWICRDMFGLALAPVVITATRACAAAAVLAGVLLVIGTSDPGIAQWLLGLVGGMAAYVAALLATRETTVAEVTAVPRLIGSGLARSRAPREIPGDGEQPES